LTRVDIRELTELTEQCRRRNRGVEVQCHLRDTAPEEQVRSLVLVVADLVVGDRISYRNLVSAERVVVPDEVDQLRQRGRCQQHQRNEQDPENSDSHGNTPSNAENQYKDCCRGFYGETACGGTPHFQMGTFFSRPIDNYCRNGVRFVHEKLVDPGHDRPDTQKGEFDPGARP
jgi:hypothetical protein